MWRSIQINPLPFWYDILTKIRFKTAQFLVDSTYGSLIKKELIPAIAYLRLTYPLRIGALFQSDFLENFRVNGDLDCTDIMSTDFFFDSICLYKLR